MTTRPPNVFSQVARSLGLGHRDSASQVAPLDRKATERVAWTGSLVAGWVVAVAALVLAVAAILAFVQRSPVALVPLIVGLGVLTLSRIEVVADGRGLRVRFGPLRWPSRFIPIDTIATVGRIDLRPLEWGGWGYRLARSEAGRARTAVVLRSGDALHLTLRNGREFAVTIDNACEPAAVLAAYLGSDETT